MGKIELLKEEERLLLPLVLQRRIAFQKILENSLRNTKTTFSNCLMIQGQAGTGKTTTVINSLSELKEKGVIHDYVKENPGSIQVDIRPNPNVVAAVSVNGEKYVRSAPNAYGHDNLLSLPRE